MEEEILASKILIVDDNQVNVTLLTAILEGEGYANLVGITDPREVLDLYGEHNFDIILLDLQMPHLSGFQVMEQLAGMVGDDYLPILVLTAKADAETKHRALRSGAKDYLTKPFDRIEVGHRIRNMLEVRILYNRQRQQRQRVEAEVRKRTEELRDTQFEFIRQLGRAGEYRDNETGMHVRRMSKGCQTLGRSLGFSEERSELILYASPMHDVGKIGIPDSILLKPGRLEPAEWEIMKTHVDIGAEILSDHPSEIIRLARTIAWSHHEKWDGSGYPKCLKGSEIPIEGRIAAVCDVFDALTSRRPYKEPWPVDRAMRFMTENSAEFFDPKVVDHFVEIKTEIFQIREQYPDSDGPDAESAPVTLTPAPDPSGSAPDAPATPRGTG